LGSRHVSVDLKRYELLDMIDIYLELGIISIVNGRSEAVPYNQVGPPWLLIRIP
jgi:hypothetical protein